MSSSESYDDKPEIRELYLAAEIELKELVEGFTHTFVHNLLKEGSQETTSRQFWEDGEEDSLMMDEEYFSRPFSNEYRHGCALEEVPMFAMEVTVPARTLKFPFFFLLCTSRVDTFFS